ncbi:Guanine nucleotide-binding protein subunit alpha [Hondaea fermentalgiana]|uniref:Guanine nucleotide-binding protein subunit alpha n=1 Tax=Hondaea fermentalgiana TaxID=2315210 RepID=A0A2R5GBE3_9STRA|nr:Guanine nucleotide-binding protein subunit alpha [Hondaea fermentalgiana]|eukprot:GBG25893.1 Guanine nucleotide-binding protein subunit alpha [Hondaea fermentalgiana]
MGGTCSVNTADDTKHEMRLLLLGSPGVGKSTVFKQLTLIYTNGFDDTQRRALRSHVLFDIFDSVLRIAEVARQRDGEDFLVDTKLQAQLRQLIEVKETVDESASQLTLEQIAQPQDGAGTSASEEDQIDLHSPKSDARVKELLHITKLILQDAKMTRAMQSMKDSGAKTNGNANATASANANANANTNANTSANSRKTPMSPAAEAPGTLGLSSLSRVAEAASANKSALLNEGAGSQTDDSLDLLDVTSAEDESHGDLVYDSFREESQQEQSIRAAEAARNAARAAERVELPGSWEHFSKRLHQMAAADAYIPSDNDILRLRRVTEEPVSLRFGVTLEWPPKSGKDTSLPVQCVDVGGQAHHEFDWVQFGQDATAVLFVMCPSEFDEFDEAGDNKLRKSMQMLRKIASSEVFANTQIILLFNKSDLLEKKLRDVKFSEFSRNFKGDNTVKNVTHFLEKRCRAIISSSVSQSDASSAPRVSVVKTCAIETSLMSTVIRRVLHGLFESALMQVW